MPCQVHPEVEEALQLCSRCGQSFCADCVIELRGGYFCATCKLEQIKDIRSGADSTRLELATISRRFFAFVLDMLVIIIPTLAMGFLVGYVLLGKSYISFDDEDYIGLGYELFIGLIASVPGFLYEGLMLRARGQTVGKIVLGLKVVTAEGTHITASQAWTRALTRSLLGIHFFTILDYIFALGAERTCLHDKAAKTRVIRLH